jgi:O-antigen ligase
LIVLATCGLLAAAWDEGGRFVTWPPLLSPAAAFVGVIGVSTLFSVDPIRSLTLSTALLPAALLFVLVTAYFREPKHFDIFLVSLSLLGVGTSLAVVWVAVENPQADPTAWISTLSSPSLVVPNDISMLAVIFPFSLALVLRRDNRGIRLLAGASMVLSILAISLLQSRTGVLVLLVSTVGTLALIRPRLMLGASTIIVLLVVSIDGSLDFPLLSKFVHVSELRIWLWLAAWDMFLDAPLLGHGPHSYGTLFTGYMFDLEPPEWLAGSTGIEPWPLTVVSPWAHNLYLEVLAEQGIVGFVSLMVLFVAMVRLGFKLRRARHDEIRLYGVAALGSLMGFCVAGLLELSLIRLWVTIFLAVLIAVLAQLSRLNLQKEDQ